MRARTQSRTHGNKTLDWSPFGVVVSVVKSFRAAVQMWSQSTLHGEFSLFAFGVLRSQYLREQGWKPVANPVNVCKCFTGVKTTIWVPFPFVFDVQFCSCLPTRTVSSTPKLLSPGKQSFISGNFNFPVLVKYVQHSSSSICGRKSA